MRDRTWLHYRYLPSFPSFLGGHDLTTGTVIWLPVVMVERIADLGIGLVPADFLDVEPADPNAPTDPAAGSTVASGDSGLDTAPAASLDADASLLDAPPTTTSPLIAQE